MEWSSSHYTDHRESEAPFKTRIQLHIQSVISQNLKAMLVRSPIPRAERNRVLLAAIKNNSDFIGGGILLARSPATATPVDRSGEAGDPSNAALHSHLSLSLSLRCSLPRIDLLPVAALESSKATTMNGRSAGQVETKTHNHVVVSRLYPEFPNLSLVSY